MTVTIQEGIDAGPLQQVIYELIRAGMEADARAAGKRHAERLALIAKSGGTYQGPAEAAQGSLFDA